MNSITISTNSFEPNTKLTKLQLSELEDKLDDAGPNREITLEVAKTIRDNTLLPLTENELNRMIFMLEEKKGSIREIQSIILRAIMMAIPFSNGGKYKNIKLKKYKSRKYKLRKYKINHKRKTNRK